MQSFGPWVFAGMVMLVSYAAVQTFAPQYSQHYVLLILLTIVLFYFARGNTGAPQPRKPGQPF